MRLERLTSTEDPRFASCVSLYQLSFPFHEQREAASQQQIMDREEYRFEMIYDEDVFIGLMLNWETPQFIYVEHFCILPSMRNKRYGESALKLLAERNKLIILEIDPPIDDISRRRKRFYERTGFLDNSYPHIHPPYHAGYDGHELEIMSLPRRLTQKEYESFLWHLRNVVMK